jgi:L-ascorbate metabolism protein UlaG (beta-lactamase superfamily)
MEIIYLGHSSFRISGKTTKLITDPFDPEKVGLKFPKAEADIVTVSHSHFDHNKVDLVENVRKIVDGPGEYEIGGVSIIGIHTFHDNKKGAERGKNTIYVIEIDGIKLLHLGDLGHSLTEAQKSEIGDIDVMFIPVGGVYTIDAKEAFEIVKSISPHIVIPMHYKLPDAKDGGASSKLGGVDEFLTISGLAVEKLPKLNVKEGMFTPDEIKIVVLDAKK